MPKVRLLPLTVREENVDYPSLKHKSDSQKLGKELPHSHESVRSVYHLILLQRSEELS